MMTNRQRILPVVLGCGFLLYSTPAQVAYGQEPTTDHLAAAPGTLPAGSPPPKQLFLPATAQPARPLELGSEVVEHRLVAVNLPAMAAVRSGETIEMDLLPGRILKGRVDRLTRRSSRQHTFRGQIDGSQQGMFVASMVDESLAMAVRVPEQNLFIMVRSVGGGDHLVSRIDESRLPLCGTSRQASSPPGEQPEAQRQTAESPTAEADPQAGTCVQPEPVWDMVVLYTDDARVAAGSTADIQSLIHLFVEEANMSYELSGINARLRMVYLGEVTYAESGDLDIDLDRLTSGSDGLGVAHTLRETYYCDSVMLVIGNASTCGLAWCCSSTVYRAYATTVWNCWGRTFTHEFGHNLGCAHNVEDVDCGGCYGYARGHRFVGNDGGAYKTIMSYNDAAGTYSNIWHFSNPSVSYQGQPTGIVDERDNVRTINNRRFAVEAFKATHMDVWVDFSWFSTQSGTFGQPYRLISDGQDHLVTGVSASEMPTMHIKTGSNAQTPTLNKPMVVRACGGPVTIGRN